MQSDTRRKFNENLTALIFIGPFIGVFAVFLGYPVVYSFFLSLHKTTIYSNWYNKFSDMTWCGLEHYRNLLSNDPVFWWSLISTFIYAILTIPTSIAVALTLALILNPKLKGFSFFRSGFFLPNVFDMFVVGVIWLFLYNPTDGLFMRIIMAGNVKPVVRGLASLAGIALFWLGPIAVFWLVMQFKQVVSPSGIPSPGDIRKQKRYRFQMRLLIAGAVIVVFYIFSLAGVFPESLWLGFLFLAGALGLFFIMMKGRHLDDLDDMPPGQRSVAYIFGGLFFLFLLGTLWGKNPANLLFRMPFNSAESLMKELNAGFLGSPVLVLPSIALAMVLKGAGFGMVLFLIAINGISPSVLEAAEIDGCTGFQKVKNVILPLVKPIVLFMIITGLVMSLNAFTEIYAMTNNTGGPSMTFMNQTVRAARISGYHLYRTFDDAFYGEAAAISYILLVIALVISYINFRILREKE